jgi:hypothetical protein
LGNIVQHLPDISHRIVLLFIAIAKYNGTLVYFATLFVILLYWMQRQILHFFVV